MNEVKVIHTSILLGKEIDVYGTKDEPLFKAKDVAEWLGLTNVSEMIKTVGEDERSKFNLGRQGETWMLSEDGLYEVFMQSRKPIAKQFKKGVKEILKSIRKTGGYIASNATDTPEMIMARALKVADETIKRNEQRMRELEAQTEQQATTIGLQQERLTAAAPKVDYYDKTLASKDCMTTTQIANDIGLSAKTLNKKLHEAGIIYNQSGQWIVNAKYKGWNLYASRTYTYQREDGETGTKVTTVWNQRGRRFILALHRNGYNVADALKEIKGNKK